MSSEETSTQQFLAPPAVAALRREDGVVRVSMERTISSDIRAEREDLKQAAEQSLNVILDLGLDGAIRWVSPSWKDVVGTSAESVKGTPIADILLSNKEAFADAVESMKKDESRSQIVRFRVRMGPSSVLNQEPVSTEDDTGEGGSSAEGTTSQEEEILNLEGQGIMVYDRSSGGESHVCVPIVIVCQILTKQTTDNVDDPSIRPAERSNN